MAPTTAFVKIAPGTLLAVRVFINMKSIAKMINKIESMKKQSALFHAVIATTDTTKSMVTLQRTGRVRLSSNDMNKLLTIFRDDLIRILFKEDISCLEKDSVLEDNLDYVHINSKTFKNRCMIIPLVKEGWKIHVVLQKLKLESLRYLCNGDSRSYGRYTRVLTKTTEFKFPAETPEDPELSDLDLTSRLAMSDSKSNKPEASFIYSTQRLMGTQVDIYVLSRP